MGDKSKSSFVSNNHASVSHDSELSAGGLFGDDATDPAIGKRLGDSDVVQAPGVKTLQKRPGDAFGDM